MHLFKQITIVIKTIVHIWEAGKVKHTNKITGLHIQIENTPEFLHDWSS